MLETKAVKVRGGKFFLDLVAKILCSLFRAGWKKSNKNVDKAIGQSQLDLMTPYTVDIEATSPKPYVTRIRGTYFPVWEPYKTQMDSVRVLFSSVMLSLVRVLFDGRSLKQMILCFGYSISQ